MTVYALQVLRSKAQKWDVVHIPANSVQAAIDVADDMFREYLEDNAYVQVRITKMEK